MSKNERNTLIHIHILMHIPEHTYTHKEKKKQPPETTALKEMNK